MSKISVRPGRGDDAEALAVFAERIFRDTFAAQNSADDMDLHCRNNFGPEIQRRELNDPSYITLIGEAEERLAAFAQIRLTSRVDCVEAAAPAEILRFYVDQRWHGQGVAQSLMNEALARVEKTGADCVWLGVWEHNPRALTFYSKYGFEVVGDHVFQLGSDTQRDLVMALR